MRWFSDLKGQVRFFPSPRSLHVFAEPNATPSVTHVCPLLPSLRFSAACDKRGKRSLTHKLAFPSLDKEVGIK